MAATTHRATASKSNNNIFCFSHEILRKLTKTSPPSAEKHTAQLMEKIPAILRGDVKELAAIAEQPDANRQYREFRRHSIYHSRIYMLLNPPELSQTTSFDDISKLFDLKQPRGIFAAQLQKIIATDSSKKEHILPAIKKIIKQGEIHRNSMLEELVQIATWEELSDITFEVYFELDSHEQTKLLKKLFNHFKENSFLFDIFEELIKKDAPNEKKDSFFRNTSHTTNFIKLVLDHFLENKYETLAKNLKSMKGGNKVDPKNAAEQANQLLEILKKSEEIKSMAKKCNKVFRPLFSDEQEYKERMTNALNAFIFLRGTNPFFSQYPMKNKIKPEEKWTSFAQFLQYCVSGNSYSLENQTDSERAYRIEMNKKIQELHPNFDLFFKHLIN